MVTGFSPGNAHVGFEVVDGTFHNGPDFIGGNPFLGVALDTGEHTEIHVVVSVSGPPLLGGAAGFLTVTDPLPFYHMDFWADPFIPVRTPFFMAVPGIFHAQAAVLRAGGVAINVVADLFKGALIPGVIRDYGLGKMELILKEAVSFNGIKSGIPKEGIGVEPRVQRKEIGEYWL